MRIADGTRMKEPREGCETEEGVEEREGKRGFTEKRRRTRKEYAGGPNPPAVRSYRRNKHFSRNNPQRLEKRLIDCPTHDFACKGAPWRRFFLPPQRRGLRMRVL